MALAETLSAYHGKSILLIDADGQMSLSLMVMPVDTLNYKREAGHSIAGWLTSTVLSSETVDWRTLVAEQVSDIDKSKNLFILPGDMDLTLVEREIVAQDAITSLRRSCRQLLAEARQQVDLILVDCAPGISVVTECWLRECDWHIVPAKPDILAVSGMEYLKRFKQRDPELGFATHLGVIINMKDMRSQSDHVMHDLLRDKRELRCFRSAVPLVPHIQKAAMFTQEKRSYQNKYPGEAGAAFRDIATELLGRLREPRSSSTFPTKDTRAT
jgi:chromosome partitioning protein